MIPETGPIGFTSAVTASSARLTRNIGVNIFPTHVSIFPGLRENHSTAAKNTRENIHTSHFAVPSATSGLMPTEKDVDAQRGIANNGPIVRYSAQVNTLPYVFPTLLLISSNPSLRLIPSEATPRSGIPTPVMRKPIIAFHTFAPAF